MSSAASMVSVAVGVPRMRWAAATLFGLRRYVFGTFRSAVRAVRAGGIGVGLRVTYVRRYDTYIHDNTQGAVVQPPGPPASGGRRAFASQGRALRRLAIGGRLWDQSGNDLPAGPFEVLLRWDGGCWRVLAGAGGR